MDNLAFDITATMGPACRTKEAMLSLLAAGATSCRFPFAKETHAWQFEHAAQLRDVSIGAGLPVSLVVDLPGAQPRFANLHNIPLKAEDVLTLVPEAVHLNGGPESGLQIGVSHWEGLLGIQSGSLLIVGDGELALRILEADCDVITAVVTNDSTLTQKRRLIVEGNSSCVTSATSEDEEIISEATAAQFDRIFVSFVRGADDIRRVKEMVATTAGGQTLMKVIAKIETFDSISNIEAICQIADGVLIGRGDLALQTGPFAFPAAQEKAIRLAVETGKPVQVGTQLLESCADNWVPYRAEISDLWHLMNLGITGILLSAETTVSSRPAAAVRFAYELRRMHATRRHGTSQV